MNKVFKKIIREFLVGIRAGVTRNLRYDIQTIDCLKKILKSDSNCIDVGAHEGEILELMLKFAPQGRHFAFEPIPALHRQLQDKFADRVKVMSCALAAEKGNTTFLYVKNAPAYSGLKKRTYALAPDIEEIEVQIEKLDDLIPHELNIHLIKIDVEGAELGVLHGAERIIKTHQPYIIFECGLGASEHYGTGPDMVFDFLASCGLSLYLLSDFLSDRAPLSRNRFIEIFQSNSDYYFLAGLARK